jgi:hypothetical protein
MRYSLISILLAAVLCGAANVGMAIDEVPGSGEVISVPEGATPRVVIVGALIEDFPSTLPVDVTDSGYHLDADYQLKADWIVDSNDTTAAQDISLTDLEDFDWFDSWESLFKVGVFIGGMDGLDDWAYRSCLPGEKLEAPEDQSYPLDSNTLRITDYHGGSVIWVSMNFLRHGLPGSDYFWVVAAYAAPGDYTDYTDAVIHAEPGNTVYLLFIVTVGNTEYRCPVPVKIVQHVSEDVAKGSQSRPKVDAADLAALSAHMNEMLRWGHSTENPQYDPNFMFDFNLSGEGSAINAGDLSAYAAAISDSCESAPGKADNAAERAAMFEWFGIAATGQMTSIGPNGETGPEYDVVDWEKNRRACADPYGYRNSIASAKATSWSRAKTLFR